MVDVAIIGLGITGASIARELTRYKLSVLCLERGNGLSGGATRANSGIVHAGHDAKPGSLKAKFNVEGNRLFAQWASELDFPFRKNGSLVLAHAGDAPEALYALRERGRKNGVVNMDVLDGEQVRRLEPHLSEAVTGALLSADGGITSPYEFCIACAENARANGAQLRFNARVLGIERIGQGYVLHTAAGDVQARTVVNAAGLYADEIHNMVCEDKLRIQPRKGEYLLLDNKAGAFFERTLFPLPGKMGKGILVTPTVDGNLLLGPTSQDIDAKEDTSTTAAGMAEILQKVRRDFDLPMNRFITGFAGIRAHLDGRDDFVVGECEDGFFSAAGIESPGLTAAPALSRHLAALVAEKWGADLRKGFAPYRQGIRRFSEMGREERLAAIAENPRYSRMVCRCEQVTEAEVVQAVARGARTLDDVKRYTRAGMGTCQRGFCNTEILDIIARELDVEKNDVLVNEQDTNMLLSRIN